ncbi:MAG: amino acid adenylation domain-containing protein [Ignavibacteriae bacterium]|nr:amino acid adenylation domain-containing protein [Ignavibacteriota bacterium]
MNMIEAKYPLSHGQKALWYLQKVSPNSPAYNIFRGADVNHELDVNVFKDAFQVLVNRHPALRTTFSYIEGEPFQIVHNNIGVDFNVVDSSGWNKDTIDERLNKEALLPFDLENGPLSKIFVLKHSKTQFTILFSFHHIISDLWSLAIKMKEIGIIYDAKISNIDYSLPKINYKYSDFVNSQLEFISSSKGKEQWNYWEQQLKDKPIVLGLETDKQRPNIQTFFGESALINIGNETINKLNELAKSTQTTLFSILLSAYHVLLYRYSGNEKIIIGTSKAGRKRNSIRTLGYFINAAPIVGDLTGNPKYIDFLRQVHQTNLESAKNDEFPFSLTVEKLQPERDLSRTPIFQVFFTMQKTTKMIEGDGLAAFSIGESGGKMNWGSIPLVSRGLQKRIAPFDITLLVAETGGEYLASMEFNIDLFNHETIVRMLSHYENLLNSIATNPEQTISNLPMFNLLEQEKIIKKWNNNVKNILPNNNVVVLFEKQVNTYPNAKAVVYKQGYLTYSELNKRSNKLAHYLTNKGIGVEDLIGICIDRSYEMIISILGILKAGATFVPLDPEYPKDRLSYMIHDANLSFILTNEKTAKSIPKNGAEFIIMDTGWLSIEKENSENISVKTFEDNLAYVIYTSGSTGNPKGVLLTHKGLLNVIISQQREFNISNETHLLQFASFSFDASVSEIFTTLLAGAQLHLIEQNTLLSGGAIVNDLNNRKISTVTLPPSLLEVLPSNELEYVNTIISAGESCPKKIAKTYSKTCNFINAYGPTESTICATLYHCKEGNNYHSVPIGKPIDNTQIFLLDRNLNPVPIGVPGEIFIGGLGLARAYQNMPCLTAAVFIPNPFLNSKGSRMYRTGDLAKYLPDGNIEFLGRIDHQVKVRGFRIEPGEIESKLNDHSDISQAVVVSNGENSVDQKLVAYYTLSNGQDLSKLNLRNYLRESLPDYMIPSSLIKLENIPITPNGKINKNQLPDPDNVFSNKNDFIQPDSVIEKQISNIWKEILNSNKVGLNDSFFDLGGHSLNVIQVQTEIKDKFNKEVTVVDLFKYPTVKLFANFLSNGSNNSKQVEDIKERVDKQKILLAQRQAIMKNRRRA